MHNKTLLGDIRRRFYGEHTAAYWCGYHGYLSCYHGNAMVQQTVMDILFIKRFFIVMFDKQDVLKLFKERIKHLKWNKN